MAYEEESQALSRSWRNLQRSLSGERGLWMESDSAELTHWKLDKFEDPCRRWEPSSLILTLPSCEYTDARVVLPFEIANSVCKSCSG